MFKEVSAMQFVRQIVGFVMLIVFLAVLGFIQSSLAAFGAPGIISWPVGVIVTLGLFVGAFVGWARLKTWRLESKPGVKQWQELDLRAFDLQKKGEFAAAAPMYEQAVPLAEATRQPLIVATALNNLAGVYVDQERWPEARALFRRAYDMRKEALGADHQLTITTGERLTGSEVALGHWADAEAIQRELLPLYIKNGGPDGQGALETMRSIAVACRHQGNYTEALRLYQEEEGRLGRKKELDSEMAASLYNDWAFCLVASGSPAAALAFYDRAIAIREKRGDSTDLATSLDNRADAQVAHGDNAGAAATSQRWFEVMERVLAHMGPRGQAALVPMIEQHAKRLDAGGRTQEAEALRTRAAQIRSQHTTEVAEVEARIARIADAEGVS